MNYVSWLWYNSCGIRWNTAVQIVAGIGQVVLGLLMVWLSKQFIDETIREGSTDDDAYWACELVRAMALVENGNSCADLIRREEIQKGYELAFSKG